MNAKLRRLYAATGVLYLTRLETAFSETNSIISYHKVQVLNSLFLGQTDNSDNSRCRKVISSWEMTQDVMQRWKDRFSETSGHSLGTPSVVHVQNALRCEPGARPTLTLHIAATQ